MAVLGSIIVGIGMIYVLISESEKRGEKFGYVILLILLILFLVVMCTLAALGFGGA